MPETLRASTLYGLGLGTALEIFKRGRMPVSTADLMDRVFGPSGARGALVISGANGIVGAGKLAQLGSRLEPFGVPIVALDLPGSGNAVSRQAAGLAAAFGRDKAARILANVVSMSYDGNSLPPSLKAFRPRFLLEAIPEVLELKKAHYARFRASFPDLEIRSVTSGFPSSELGVPVAHPAFPHEVNRVFEVVEPQPSAITQLLWSLGLVPMPVSDHWSFVLDVLFCGITLAALRVHRATNLPCWKVDKLVRALVGPNPCRAHDAIGAKGANFLTWSCLHHLAQHYGALFEPTPELEERRVTGEDWYPLNHLRPVVGWSLAPAEQEEVDVRLLGPLFQMTSLVLHEKRSHLAQVNAIGEQCAQFTPGVVAQLRAHGADAARATVSAYHRLHPEAAGSAWHPEALAAVETPEGRQLYVNAEHDGRVGVVTIGRESYSADVDSELTRAVDWLKAEGIERVIVTGDFHLATQLVGADTREFYPALADPERVVAISRAWSATARRLHDEFAVSVGVVNGKRCLGGMLELMLHCHVLIAVEGAQLGMPEVTLPVIPGMEGCHWPFRKVKAGQWPRLVSFLLEGRSVPAEQAAGWLVDLSAPLEQAAAAAWAAASGEGGPMKRPLDTGRLEGVADALPTLSDGGPEMEAGRRAILDCVRAACSASLAEAVEVQARHSGAFMATPACRSGAIGTAYAKTMVT
jgi:enoyl-CoA hydratase/carnithine racemase